MFRDAVDELVTNVLTHNDSDSPTLTVEVDPDSALTTAIRIVDNGPGILDTEVEPLKTRQEDPLHHPSGMGFWFVDWTIEHSNGPFAIQQNDTGGTTATITVPKASTGPHAGRPGPLWPI